eukprot:9268798-Pyramimonas_sp.AAC.1
MAGARFLARDGRGAGASAPGAARTRSSDGRRGGKNAPAMRKWKPFGPGGAGDLFFFRMEIVCGALC